LVGQGRRLKRFILVEENGTWTHAKVHHVDERDADAPIGPEENRPQEKSAQV